MAVQLAKATDNMTFKQVKDKIVFTLVKKDEEVARRNVTMDYLDMMIRFYIHMEENKFIPVTKQIATKLDVDEVDLMTVSLENTPRILGFKIQKISETIAEYTGDDDLISAIETDEDDCIPIYVVRNNLNYNGAGAILYTGAMKSLAEKLKSNYYVIPCSIHEVIVVKQIAGVDVDVQSLIEMIGCVNQNDLPPEEVLSNSLYYYDKETDELSIVK